MFLAHAQHLQSEGNQCENLFQTECEKHLVMADAELIATFQRVWMWNQLRVCLIHNDSFFMINGLLVRYFTKSL
jgi:hypothetical protein